MLLTGCTNLYIPKMPQYDYAEQEIRVIYSHQATKVPLQLLPGEIDDGKERTRNLIACAKYVDGIPTVYADPNVLMTFSEEGQSFVIHHEIAHLQLGHHHDYSIGITQQERETDCKAAWYLKEELHYSESQMQNVLDDVRKHLDENRYKDLKICLHLRYH